MSTTPIASAPQYRPVSVPGACGAPDPSALQPLGMVLGNFSSMARGPAPNLRPSQRENPPVNAFPDLLAPARRRPVDHGFCSRPGYPWRPTPSGTAPDHSRAPPASAPAPAPLLLGPLDLGPGTSVVFPRIPTAGTSRTSPTTRPCSTSSCSSTAARAGADPPDRDYPLPGGPTCRDRLSPRATESRAAETMELPAPTAPHWLVDGRRPTGARSPST